MLSTLVKHTMPPVKRTNTNMKRRATLMDVHYRITKDGSMQCFQIHGIKCAGLLQNCMVLLLLIRRSNRGPMGSRNRLPIPSSALIIIVKLGGFASTNHSFHV
jgi:hypothetical protein